LVAELGPAAPPLLPNGMLTVVPFALAGQFRATAGVVAPEADCFGRFAIAAALGAPPAPTMPHATVSDPAGNKFPDAAPEEFWKFSVRLKFSVIGAGHASADTMPKATKSAPASAIFAARIA